MSRTFQGSSTLVHPPVKLMSNNAKTVSKHIKECGLTQEAPYVKEYVKSLTYRLTQERGGVLMRAGGRLQVDRRRRGGNTNYFCNPPQADGVDGEARVDAGCE